jgi:hypothetical protein
MVAAHGARASSRGISSCFASCVPLTPKSVNPLIGMSWRKGSKATHDSTSVRCRQTLEDARGRPVSGVFASPFVAGSFAQAELIARFGQLNMRLRSRMTQTLGISAGGLRSRFGECKISTGSCVGRGTSRCKYPGCRSCKGLPAGRRRSVGKVWQAHSTRPYRQTPY